MRALGVVGGGYARLCVTWRICRTTQRPPGHDGLIRHPPNSRGHQSDNLGQRLAMTGFVAFLAVVGGVPVAGSI
jgi:hypothetical protein